MSTLCLFFCYYFFGDDRILPTLSELLCEDTEYTQMSDPFGFVRFFFSFVLISGHLADV